MNIFIEKNQHRYEVRRQNQKYICVAKHEFSKKCIRHSLPILLNDISENIQGKVHTHSLQGYSQYVKNIYISNYSNSCNIQQCYVCNDIN